MGKKILITGGLGFIGSNLVRYWSEKYPVDTIYVIDAHTYAARPEYLKDIADKYHCFAIDIRKKSDVEEFMNREKPDDVIHLAAESHVCRSIEGPGIFFGTNVMGTFHLVHAFHKLWGTNKNHRFHHISTDEVFGELMPGDPPFHEDLPMKPRSPYAASKAASDHVVQSFFHTYSVNTIISNSTNNFGPNQHDEKLIPKAIKSILGRDVMTIYGPGNQIRDWIYVLDHCKAIDRIFHEGRPGERYCVGGSHEMTNMEVIEAVRLSVMRVTKQHYAMKTIHTQDRPTDDFRYAVDNSKVNELGWEPSTAFSKGRFLRTFEDNLDQTVIWYLHNTDWRK